MMDSREEEWAGLMRAANAGDEAAYRRLLLALAPVLRAAARGGLARAGLGSADVEDIVQETLLALHLKRHTWDPGAPFGPWLRAIARNKLVDSLRRRGGRIMLPVDDFADVLPADPVEESVSAREIDRALSELSEGQRAVVRSVAVDGVSIRETSLRLGMSEGAVRVALHRGLAALAARFGSGKT